MARQSGTRKGSKSVDLEAVFALAECGHTLPEILARLEVPAALPLALRQAVADAFSKGRASGVAQVKAAQLKAALEGKTSAQAQVLKHLGAGGEEDDEAAQEVAVVREIIRAGDEGGENGEG